ncbi:MAG: putative metalloprotease CJM1_0395 family protein [Pseudomonadota bacterium]
MIGPALGSTAFFATRPPDADAAGERFALPERRQEVAQAQSLPANAPGDGIGGATQRAVASTSNASAAFNDPRNRNANTLSDDQETQPTRPSASGDDLTPEEEQRVRELEARDREVRAHEQAHARVGGPLASAPTYQFVTGPDGQQYAVGGEVQIDSAPIPGDPEGTIRKLDIVIRAALAPAEPSSQDLAVARQARADQAEARTELRELRQFEREGGDDENPAANEAAFEQAAAAYAATQNAAGTLFGNSGGLLA